MWLRNGGGEVRSDGRVRRIWRVVPRPGVRRGSESEGAGSDSGKPGSESDVTCSESEIGSRSDMGPVTGSGERFCSRLE